MRKRDLAEIQNGRVLIVEEDDNRNRRLKGKLYRAKKRNTKKAELLAKTASDFLRVRKKLLFF